MAVTWFYMATPIGYDRRGRLGLFGLLLSLQFLLVTLVSAALAGLAWSRQDMLSTSVFIGAAALTAVMALWPTIALLRRAREYESALSLVAALIPRRNGGGPQLNRSLVYGTAPDGTELELDVWRSTVPNGRTPHPALVRVHGGEWVRGARSELVEWDTWLNAHGFDVFDVAYRTSPPERWKDAVGDIKSAVGWVATHAEEYGVDRDRISLIGCSAGGNLSMLAAYSMGDPELPPSCDVQPVKIRSVVNLYGPADLTMMYEYSAENGSDRYVQGALNQYIGGPPSAHPDRYRALSPVTHVSADSPPTITVLGENDRLIPPEQVELLDAALGEAGVPHESCLLPFSDHGFDENWSSLSTQLARARIESFLQRYAVPETLITETAVPNPSTEAPPAAEPVPPEAATPERAPETAPGSVPEPPSRSSTGRHRVVDPATRRPEAETTPELGAAAEPSNGTATESVPVAEGTGPSTARRTTASSRTRRATTGRRAARKTATDTPSPENGSETQAP